MQEVETRARLVGLDGDKLAARGPTAVLPRTEIEEVIAGGEYPARLVLDVARGDGQSGGDVVAEARVAVEWEKAELEELLRASTGDSVTLSFDEDELERVLEGSDVDAHGLRERVAVLGIVIATAGATAGGALAHPQLSGEATGGASGSSTPSFVTDSRGGDGGAAAAPEAAPSFITDSRGGTGGLAPTEVGTTRFITDSRGGTGGVDTAAPATGGTSISLPSPGDAAGIAGVVLFITAAGFVAARSRRDRELPA